MLVSNKEYLHAKSINDFTELMSTKIKKLLDVEDTDRYEVLFVEKMSKDSFVVLTKGKSKRDIDNKQLLVFVIEGDNEQSSVATT
jgi:hypothetical protein